MESSNVLDAVIFYSVNLALIGLIVNVLVCSLTYKKMEAPFRRLFYFLIFNLLIELSAILFTKMGVNNLPLLHLYTLGEFVLLSYFFRSIISKPSFLKKWFTYLMAIGSALIILNSIFFQSIYGFNSLAKTGVQIVIIVYAVLYFYNLVENQSLQVEVAKSLRLINSAIIIYYSGSLFVFMCSQISLIKIEEYEIFWIFNALLNFVFQLLILWGLWRLFFRKITWSS